MNEDKQLEDELVDWLTYVVWGVLLAALVLGAVFGHSAVSVAHGQGDPMPILQVDHYLPTITK